MSDFLVQLSKNPQARSLIKTLGLPVPMPEELDRPNGPSVERPLEGKSVAFYSVRNGAVAAEMAEALTEAGATPFVFGDDAAFEPFKGPGEAYGRPAQRIEVSDEEKPSIRFGGLVLDATGMESIEDLNALYDFFHPLMYSIAKCGRILVIGRPPKSMKTAAASAAMAALEGFVRSAAKEVGRLGATAQLIYVEEGAESNLAGPTRFVLSSASAYVTGQPIVVSRGCGLVNGSRRWAFPLEGKVALVTGAARGIGAATAKLLASEGAKVVCLDRPGDEDALSTLARSIDGLALGVDVTADDAAERICAFLTEQCGGVDIVVHNAGVTRDKTLARMRVEHWNQAIDVNLGAVVRITDALLEGTLNDGGRLVFLSSIAGIAGNMGQTNYAASKSGIIGLVRSLSESVAERGITANAVAPGFIETRLTDAIPIVIREVARRMNSLSQGGKPSDVAQAINFFSSPNALGVSGQVLRVCGGSLVGA